MTKQEYVKKAYEGNELALPHIQENGWIISRHLSYLAAGLTFRYCDLDREEFKWRPRSLRGVENNNGWTKVESVIDLPHGPGTYRLIRGDGSEKTVNKKTADFTFLHWRNPITHWKLVTEDDKPLY
jgi:hypothetical protein